MSRLIISAPVIILMSLWWVRSCDCGGVLCSESAISESLSSKTCQHHSQRENDGESHCLNRMKSSIFSSLCVCVSAGLLPQWQDVGENGTGHWEIGTGWSRAHSTGRVGHNDVEQPLSPPPPSLSPPPPLSLSLTSPPPLSLSLSLWLAGTPQECQSCQ